MKIFCVKFCKYCDSIIAVSMTQEVMVVDDKSDEDDDKMKLLCFTYCISESRRCCVILFL